MTEDRSRAGYKQTDIGVIPEDWENQRLGDIAKLERGKFSARPRNDPKFFGGDIPFIQTGDVAKSNGHITSYSQTLNHEGLSISKLFPRNTLFFTIAANIGDLGISSFATACPDSLVAIIPKSGVCQNWLFHTLGSRKARFEGLATQNAQLNINLEKLNPFLLTIPPLPEQRSIAQALSDVDTLITALDKLIAKKRNLKTATMQQLLTGKKRLPGFGEGKGYKQTSIGVIPEDWDVVPLGQYVNISSGESPSKFNFIDRGIPYFKVEQLNNDAKYLTTTSYFFLHGKTVPARSIIFPKRGASIMLNKLRILKEDSFMDTNLMTLTTIESLENEYLYYFLDKTGLSQVADTINFHSSNK